MMGVPILHDASDAYSAEVITAALGRSFGRGEVLPPGSFGVMVNPGDESAGALRGLLEGGGKALVFGRVGEAVAAELGLRVTGGPEIFAARADAAVNANEPFNLSPLAVPTSGTTSATGGFAPTAGRGPSPVWPSATGPSRSPG